MKLIKRETFDEIAVGTRSLSLRDLMRMAVFRSPALERRADTAGPCAEWEFALHAFFDEELDAADSFMCEQHLALCEECFLEVENLKTIRRKINRFAMGRDAPALQNRCAG